MKLHTEQLGKYQVFTLGRDERSWVFNAGEGAVGPVTGALFIEGESLDVANVHAGDGAGLSGNGLLRVVGLNQGQPLVATSKARVRRTIFGEAGMGTGD